MSAASVDADAQADGPIGSRFDDRFLRKLESLALTIRRTAAGRSHGMRRSRRVGAGLEFADHRDYVPGDDLRYLDWNLYGRLERRALRLYEEDEDLSIDVLVDASASMAMGRAAQARAGVPDRRRPRLRRPGEPRSRGDDARWAPTLPGRRRGAARRASCRSSAISTPSAPGGAGPRGRRWLQRCASSCRGGAAGGAGWWR